MMDLNISSPLDDAVENSGLNIVTFNLYGFKRNWSYLHELTVSNDVVFVQEHWLLTSELHVLLKCKQ